MSGPGSEEDTADGRTTGHAPRTTGPADRTHTPDGHAPNGAPQQPDRAAPGTREPAGPAAGTAPGASGTDRPATGSGPDGAREGAVCTPSRRCDGRGRPSPWSSGGPCTIPTRRSAS